MSPELFSEREAQAALQFTADVIDQCGPRITGDPSTHQAATLIQNEFEKSCDTVAIERFKVSPKAFLGWIRLITVLYAIAVVFIWLNLPWVSGILITIGILAMVFEFFLYYKFIDPLWKSKEAVNVIGVIEPEKEVRQQIIVSGHHDSAFVFNFFVHQPKLYPLRIYGGLGSVALLWLCSWIWTIAQIAGQSAPQWPIAIKIFGVASLVLVVQMWFFRGNKGTPGAGDNLISVAIASEIAKKLADNKKQGNPLQHTRILVASWDAEEAGLRGARDYAKRHQKELNDIPSFNLNMDCPYSIANLAFLTSDINGSVKLSQAMADECVKIAQSLGYSAAAKPIAFLTGGTDSAEFAKIGVEATTLFGMPWGNSERATGYHTPQDTVDSIEPAAVQAALKIILDYILRKDHME